MRKGEDVNSIEKKNCEAMRRGFPEMYERVYGCRQRMERREDPVTTVEKMETLTDMPALVVQMKDGTIVRLNSAYDPENEAEFWGDGQKKLDVSNLFIFGLGNGVFAKEILKRRGRNTNVVIYEPSREIFFYALKNFDLSFSFTEKDVRLIVEDVNDDLFAAVMETMLDFENYEDYNFVFCPKFAELFPNGRKKLVDLYARDGQGWIRSYQMTERAKLYISPYNQLYNLRFLKKNTVVPHLKKILPKDVPVILAGAGLSLKEEIEVLRDVRDRAFLFAADSALPYLMSENLIPDAYICVEADKPLWFFEDERTRHIPLFAKLDSSYKLLDMHQAMKIFGWDDGFPQRIYEDYQVPQSEFRYGANGMTSLFSICDEIGMETVVFIGQDMCYGEDHHTHVGGRDEGFVSNKHFMYVNNKGEMVQSRLDWAKFIRWYENAVLDCGMKHVVNCCLRGVKIQGTEVMSLTEAIDKYGKPHEEFGKLLGNVEKTFHRAEQFSLRKVYYECQKEWEEIRKIINEDPHSAQRKKYRLYELLRKYEIADPENDFEKSQKSGMKELSKYIEKCLEEDKLSER